MAALLGPPELKNEDQSSDPFVNLMSDNFENADKPPEYPVNAVPPSYPFMGYTDNNSITYITSGDSCLDFFFTVVPDTPANTLVHRLNLAWAHDPLVALKLTCNLRAVRGTGKSYKEGFFTAALWLFKYHPKTLAANVQSFADLGCFKDLPEILYRLLEGPDVRQQQKQLWEMTKSGGRRGCQVYLRQSNYESSKQRRKKQKKRSKPKVPRNVRVENAMGRAKVEKENARTLRREKKIAMAKKLLTRYSRDSNFKILYESVSDHFAACLKSDLQYLKAREFRKLSLAAKWCPSLDSSFDKSTLLCESVARKVFDRESYPEYQGIEEAHYAYRVRDRLRKEVLVPLRKALKLPEIYISAKKWHLVPYDRVGSRAMTMYKQMFFRRDNKRFLTHLEEAKNGEISTTRRSGFIGQKKPKKKQSIEKVEDTKPKKSTPKPRKSTVAAGALLPHEIISAVFDQNKSEDCGQVAEAQWKRMVDDLMKKGKLRNCMAICDVSGPMDAVSGGMNGTPLEVAVAMGLLVSELSDAPWKGKLITFSSIPQFQQVQGNCLRSKVMSVRDADWGGGTDIGKVFDIILKVAVEGKLKPEQMIKRLFVFSGMNFDSDSNSRSHFRTGRQMVSSSMRGWETDYQAMVKKFMDRGYGDAVPELVFWNLKETESTVVTKYDKGVALVSGFSKNLLRIFLDHQGDLNPQAIMEAALSGKEYEKLVVVD